MPKESFGGTTERHEQPLEVPPSYGESVRTTGSTRSNNQQPARPQSISGPVMVNQQWQHPQASSSSSSAQASPVMLSSPYASGLSPDLLQFGNDDKAGYSAAATDGPTASSSRTSMSSFARRSSMSKKEKKPSKQEQQNDRESSHLRQWTPCIPPEAQKALAPLTLTADVKPITGVYSIELSNAVATSDNGNGVLTTVSPTASFTATLRHDIDVTLFFRPNPSSPSPLSPQSKAQPPPLPARRGGASNAAPSPAADRPPEDIPLQVLVKCNKGKLKLSVPDRIPSRPLRIICVLENNAQISLPLGFDGKLAIWAPAGSIELSEPLRLNSTIIPSTQNNSYITVYRITPSVTASAPSADKQATTVDLCQVNTSKGKVRVDYAKPPRRPANSDGNCTVM